LLWRFNDGFNGSPPDTLTKHWSNNSVLRLRENQGMIKLHWKEKLEEEEEEEKNCNFRVTSGMSKNWQTRKSASLPGSALTRPTWSTNAFSSDFVVFPHVR
jgi:hypothetical protein